MELTQTNFSDLVLLNDKKEPFTLSSIIAKGLNMKHHSITRIIRRHEADFLEFGKVGHNVQALKSGQNEKVYILNEEQATLLVTYLRNTPKVREFKKMLVKEFYKLKDEVSKYRIQRKLEKPIRKSLTEAIKNWRYCNQWAYKNITNLLLKTITGKNAQQLKIDRFITAYDVLTSEQLEEYKSLESNVISLLELNFTYEQIKQAIKQKTFQSALVGSCTL